MTFGSSLPYVYGTYLMSPHLSAVNQNVNKNSFGRLIDSYYGKHSLYKKPLPFMRGTGVLEFNEETKELQAATLQLLKREDLYDEDNIEELGQALTSFVDDYNTLLHSFSEIENETFQKRGSIVDTISRSKKEELGTIGIEILEDGTFTIRESGFSTDMLEHAKELFLGEHSYACHIVDKTETLGKEALSLLAPTPKFYGERGCINYVIYAGTLISVCC